MMEKHLWKNPILLNLQNFIFCNDFAENFRLMKKFQSQFIIPSKSSSETADLRTQTQTLCLKRASTQDIYLFSKFLCLLIVASPRKVVFEHLFSEIKQKYSFRVHKFSQFKLKLPSGAQIISHKLKKLWWFLWYGFPKL